MNLRDRLRAISDRFPRLLRWLPTLALLASAGGVAAYQHHEQSCCRPGASCCYPGSPCCASHAE